MYDKGAGDDIIRGTDNVNVAITGYSRDDVTVTHRDGTAVVRFKGSHELLVFDLGGYASAKLTFADQTSLDVRA
jgi:hypothetical protein